METFRDDESREGVVSFVLGGKVLVIDLDFSIDSSDPANPNVAVASVKTSYADASGAPNTEGSVSLDAFLRNSMQKFCDEVHKDEDQQNPLEAARLGSLVQDHLRYLVMLDRLAERKLDGGNRWFVDVDGLCTILENFARSEAQVVASSVNNSCVILIFIYVQVTLASTGSSGYIPPSVACSSFALSIIPFHLFPHSFISQSVSFSAS